MASLSVSVSDLESFCRKWKVWDLTHANESKSSEESQLFVRFDPRADWSLIDRIRMQEELRALLGKPVTLLKRHAAHLRSGGHRKANHGKLLFNA